jgi:16S rRNA (guanine966-N2)-methyltransferase
MRIVAGKFGGRRINPPHLSPTRPTTDFAREGLFNILTHHFDLSAISFLDLFGGTGCISYEMASRGCTDITTVDKHRECIAFMKKTIAELDIPFMKPVKADVFKFINSCHRQYDLIFAGPPYPLKNLDTIPDIIFRKALLKPGGWLILEHHPGYDFTQHPCYLQHRNYGATIFTFFKG